MVRNFIRMIQKGKYLFVNAVSEKIVFFILFILIARNFDSEVFGITVALFAFSNIMNALLDAGMSTHFQRSFAVALWNSRDELRAALKLRIVFFVVFLSAVFLYFSGEQRLGPGTVAGISSGIFVMGANHLLRSVFYGMELYEEIIVPHLGSVLFLLAAGSLSLTAGIMWLFAAMLTISPLIELTCLILKLRNRGILVFNGNKPGYKSVFNLIGASLPFGIGIISVMIYDRADLLLIEKLLDPRSVAFYAAAYSLYKIAHQLFVPFLMPLYTDFSRQYGNSGYADLRKTLDISATIMIYSIGCILIYFIAGEFFMELFYGKQYSLSSELLKILAVGLPFILLNNFTGILLNAMGRESSVRNSVLAGAVINITINIALLPAWGIIGAVITTVVTEFMIFVSQIIKLVTLKKFLINGTSEDEYYADGSLYPGGNRTCAG